MQNCVLCFLMILKTLNKINYFERVKVKTSFQTCQVECLEPKQLSAYEWHECSAAVPL